MKKEIVKKLKEIISEYQNTDNLDKFNKLNEIDIDKNEKVLKIKAYIWLLRTFYGCSYSEISSYINMDKNFVRYYYKNINKLINYYDFDFIMKYTNIKKITFDFNYDYCIRIMKCSIPFNDINNIELNNHNIIISNNKVIFNFKINDYIWTLHIVKGNVELYIYDKEGDLKNIYILWNYSIKFYLNENEKIEIN